MAEHVFKKLEDMLPELEYLEKRQVFSRDELRTIIKKRTEFEYKLQRKPCEKEDFLRYLQYELSVDMLRKRRMQRLGLNLKYSPAEITFKKRAHQTFQKALRKFCDDVRLWLQYIDFCKKMGSIRSLGKAFAMVLQLHPRKASFWVMAAKCEFEENANIEGARSLMQQSLKVNPESELLWREYCRLELLHVNKIRQRRSLLCLRDEKDQIDPTNASDEFLNNKIARIVYQKAIEAIPDSVDFRVGFLPILRLFEGTSENVSEVYDSLRDFPRDTKALTLLAKRPLEETKASAKTADDQDTIWIEAEKKCYDNFLQMANTNSSGEIWENFSRTFLELVMDSKTTQEAKRRINLVLKIFSTAENQNCMTQSMFLSKAECLLSLGDVAGATCCLLQATKIYSDSVQIWQLYLKLKTNEGNWDDLNSEFERCLHTIEEKNKLQVWQQRIESCSENFSRHLEELFENAIQQSKGISEFAALQYIDWCLSKKGAASAGKVYYRLSSTVILVPSLEFLKRGISIEYARKHPDSEKIRRIYNEIAESYGKDRTDVWLDYIRFVMNLSETATEEVGRIYLRALKTLKDDLVADFITQLSLLQAGKL